MLKPPIDANVLVARLRKLRDTVGPRKAAKWAHQQGFKLEWTREAMYSKRYS